MGGSDFWEQLKRQPIFDWPPPHILSANEARRLYGNEAQAMRNWEAYHMGKFNSNRPYANLSNRELDELMAKQLEAGRRKEDPVDYFTYKASTTSSGTLGNVFYNGSITTFDGLNVTYKYDEVGRPVAQVALDPALSKPAKPSRETDMAWLKRRVNEVCWSPS